MLAVFLLSLNASLLLGYGQSNIAMSAILRYRWVCVIIGININRYLICANIQQISKGNAKLLASFNELGLVNDLSCTRICKFVGKIRIPQIAFRIKSGCIRITLSYHKITDDWNGCCTLHMLHIRYIIRLYVLGLFQLRLVNSTIICISRTGTEK